MTSERTKAACRKSIETDGFSGAVWQDNYLRKLTAALRPRHGAKASDLAQAYVDFTNDRLPSTASADAIRRGEYQGDPA